MKPSTFGEQTPRSQRESPPDLLFQMQRNFTRAKEAVRLAVDSILASPLRSALTVFGIVVGVATVTMVGGLLEGVQQFILLQLGNLAPNIVKIEKAAFQDFLGDAQEYVEAKAKRPDLFPDDLDFLQERCGDGIEIGAQGVASLPVRKGNQSLDGISIEGVTPNCFPLISITVESGREFNAADDQFRKSVCVIGRDVVTNLFGESDPLDQEITIGSLPFRVIGVAEPKGAQFGNSQDAFALLPLKTFTKIFGERSRSLVFFAQSKSLPAQSLDDVAETVRAGLRQRHGLVGSAAGEDDFSLTTSQSAQAFGKKLTYIIGGAIYPLTGLALIVGGVVVMNMMLASVTERTREIGIRKALGATRADIGLQFLSEATLLTGMGGLFGILTAVASGRIVSALMNFPVVIPLWAFVAAFSASVSVGLIFGVLPARRAARLDPVTAISRE